MSAMDIQIATMAKTGPNGTRKASLFGFNLRNRIKDAQTPQYKTKDDAAPIAATHKKVPVTASVHISAA